MPWWVIVGAGFALWAVSVVVILLVVAGGTAQERRERDMADRKRVGL